MRKHIATNTIIPIIILVGIIGGFVVGGALAFLFQERDNFTPSQKSYISGVSIGSGYLQTQLDIEKQSPPTVDENNLLRRPHDRCIRAFYPTQALTLAGCLDAVDGNTDWTMPND